MATAPGHTFTPHLPHGARRRALLGGLLAMLLVAPAAIVLAVDDDPPPTPSVRVEQVQVGALPTDIAIAQGRAWIPSAGSDELIAIDDRAHPQRNAAYRARSGALRVASDGLTIWLAGAVGNSLTSVDPLFGGEATRHRIPIGNDAVDVAVGRDAAWVTNGAAGTVTRVDPVSDRALGPPIRTGRFPTALAVGTHDLWVVNSGDGTLARVDPRENLVVGRRVNVGRDPQDVAVGFGAVWVANRGDGTLTRIDERTGRPQATIDIGGAPSALAVTVEALIVLDSERARVIRLDPKTLRVTDVVRVGGFPSALAVGEERSLWTADARRGIVTRVSR
jgi:streptogramin lyase